MAYTKPQSPLRQGDDYVYTITTADQIVLSDGSRLEKNGKIVAGDLSTEASAKLVSQMEDYVDDATSGLLDDLKGYVEDTLLNATW